MRRVVRRDGASRLLVAVLAAVGLFSVAGARAQSVQIPVTVTRVVDGDTVDVQFTDGGTERIRLIGIDTPEVVDPRKPVQCFGREASAHALELLDGQNVSLEQDSSQGDRDIDGRLLAYVWMNDGRNFGQVMIAEGFAHEYTYDQPYAYLDSFRAAEDAAITKQAGLWSPSTCAGDTTQPADTLAAAPDPGAAESVPAAPPTSPAAPAPIATPASLASGFDPLKYIGQGDRYNCTAFVSQAQAQAVLRADPRDPNKLDADRDGIACESNRAPRDLVRVTRP